MGMRRTTATRHVEKEFYTCPFWWGCDIPKQSCKDTEEYSRENTKPAMAKYAPKLVGQCQKNPFCENCDVVFLETLDAFKQNFCDIVQNEYRSHFFADNKMMGLSGDEKGGRAGIGGKQVGLEGMNIANMKTICAHDF